MQLLDNLDTESFDMGTVEVLSGKFQLALDSGQITQEEHDILDDKLNGMMGDLLTDYLTQTIYDKPVVDWRNVDGNIYNLIGTAKSALDKVGLRDKGKELVERILIKEEAGSYEAAIKIICEYIDPILE